MVDFEAGEGRISKVVVSGDFFLEPPGALADIAGALEGARVDLGEEGLAELVRDAVGEDVEMVGFSPEAVARATLRGLERV